MALPTLTLEAQDAADAPAAPALAPRGRLAPWLGVSGDSPARSRRVNILLVAVLAMSLADLDMTLAYANSGAMIEANPLARALISHGSSGMLAAWKLLSVTLCMGILYRARTRRSAEIAAWVCFLPLVWLIFRWEKYNEQMPLIANTVLASPDQEDRAFMFGP